MSIPNIEDNFTLPELGEPEMFVPIRNRLFNDILIDLIINFVFLCNTIKLQIFVWTFLTVSR